MTDTMQLPPPMFTDNDTPRTRSTDPVTSHIAADVSQRSIKRAKVAVLYMFALHGPLVGSELNDYYHLAEWREIVPKRAYDSPRKRASELEAAGSLAVSDIRTAPGNSLPEREFTLTVKGRLALTEAGL